MARLADVNTSDIRGAIELGCRTMQSVFDADDDQHVAFFSSSVRPKACLSFSDYHSEAHVTGRHLNALLSAEDAAGVRLDEQAIELHRSAALLSYGGPVPLPLNRPHIGGTPTNFCPHNLREGFHALYALARYRNDAVARELAERSIEAVFDLWSPEDGWDVPSLEALGIHFQPSGNFISGEARMLGPLCKLCRATGSARALKLAVVLKEKAVSETYLEDGVFQQERVVTPHVHSITCVLSSLAQLADLLDDGALMARVKAFYDSGLWAMRDETGWSPESTQQTDSDHGESNNTGDILETALLLGRWGYTEGYHDAERILRCHLLPSQLRDVSFIVDPPNPQGLDGLRDVADRHRGAFGFPAPYGHESVGAGRGGVSFNMDIVGGAVGSLCEAFREAVRSDATGHRVNLLFDHETPAVRARSPYTHDCLRIERKLPGALFVRMPPWLSPSEVSVEGAQTAPVWTNGYLLLAEGAVGDAISIRFPLKDSTLTLSERLHVKPIRASLRGDAVTAMDNHGADLTYFPEIGA